LILGHVKPVLAALALIRETTHWTESYYCSAGRTPGLSLTLVGSAPQQSTQNSPPDHERSAPPFEEVVDGIKRSCMRVMLVFMNLATFDPRLADSVSPARRRFSEVIALTVANARNPVPLNMFSGETCQHFSIQFSQDLSINCALEIRSAQSNRVQQLGCLTSAGAWLHETPVRISLTSTTAISESRLGERGCVERDSSLVYSAVLYDPSPAG